jgi:hypothetical protein
MHALLLDADNKALNLVVYEGVLPDFIAEQSARVIDDYQGPFWIGAQFDEASGQLLDPDPPVPGPVEQL